MMKIWCEECNGAGSVTNALCLGSGARGIGSVQTEQCHHCSGKGYTDEHESVSMSFAHYKELKMAASKWRMIEWAITNKIEFVAEPDGWSIEYIEQKDIDRLIELYREMKQEK